MVGAALESCFVMKRRLLASKVDEIFIRKWAPDVTSSRTTTRRHLPRINLSAVAGPRLVKMPVYAIFRQDAHRETAMSRVEIERDPQACQFNLKTSLHEQHWLNWAFT